MISVSILPSNSHFPENRERAEGEGDAPARRERERERERGRRERGRSVRRLTSNPFDFTLRLRRSTSPTRRSQLQSQYRFVVPDGEPRFVVPDHDLAFVPIAIAVVAPIRRPRSRTQIRRTPKPIVLPPFFSQFDRIMIFFSWVLFVFLCDFDFCCCGGVLVVVVFDCRSLLPWVELPCEKLVGK